MARSVKLQKGATRKITPIDQYVSERVRVARLGLSLTQNAVSQQLGVTFQQVQKYEDGRNRISAGKLFELAKIFGKPIQWFFPEI